MKAAFIFLLALAVLVSAFPACAEAPAVGSYVTFGAYPQAEAGDDRTPIEWLVLDYDEANGKALLVSRYGLDSRPYHDEYADVTWETCSLRAWLNGVFLNAAFSAEEQSAILTTEVDNSQNQGYSGWNTNGGNNTQDKVFLLSYAEANKFFDVQHFSVDGSTDNTNSRVEPTAYAVKQGAFSSSNYKTADGNPAGVWWLRSPGFDQNYAAYVSISGSLLNGSVRYDNISVRPAFWLDLNADVF